MEFCIKKELKTDTVARRREGKRERKRERMNGRKKKGRETKKDTENGKVTCFYADEKYPIAREKIM